MKYTRKSIQTVLAMFAIMAFVSCKKDHVDNPQVSALSFVNANVGSPALNAFIGQSKVSSDLFTFGKDINYLNAYSGEREVSFYEGSEKKASGVFTLKDGKFYSLFVAGTWPETELVLLQDSLIRPAEGKTHIRFVNMGKDAGELDLGLTNGSTLVSQKAYKTGSEYIAVNGNASYNFVIRNHAALADTVSIPAVTLEAGRSYTVWAKGLKAGTGDNALGVALIKNN